MPCLRLQNVKVYIKAHHNNTGHISARYGTFKRSTYQNDNTNLQIILLKLVKNGFCVKVDFLQASHKIIRGHEPRGYIG